MPASLDRLRLHRVTEALLATYGRQHWWPGDSRFEVMAGAILTQNTAWRNVELALDNLKTAGLLSPEAIAAVPNQRLAALIRPAGYYNVKARRLANLCRFVLQQGGVAALADRSSEWLRAALLGVNGIGPETADSIMLYAFERPLFVIDAYTRRIFRRLDMIRGDEAYDLLRGMFERALDRDTGLYNELHALIVHHAKSHCASKPKCSGCCLLDQCAAAEARDMAASE